MDYIHSKPDLYLGKHSPMFELFTQLQRSLTIFIGLFCYSLISIAQQVPIDLPNEESVEAYLIYQTRTAYSAFAISRQGGFGSAWSHGLIAEAEKEAIANCQLKFPGYPCYVVSVDGKSLRKTVDIEELKALNIAEKNKVWTKVESNQVPIQIAQNEQQINHYRDYITKNGHKAFAATTSGAWGYSFAQSNDEQAYHIAIEQCEHMRTGREKCKVIDSNNRSTMGRIALAIKDDKPVIIDKERPADLVENANGNNISQAQAFIAHRWEEYKEANRNKAFAANNFGAMGLAKEHATESVAEEAALSACESYNELRRNNPFHSDKVAPCFVIATNNYFDLDNMEKIRQQERQPKD